MKTYFDFIMYLAFRTILIYENRRSLTLEQLHNYRLELCRLNIQYHSQFTDYDDEDFEENLHFFHSSNMDMTLEEEKEKFIEFIKDNSEYFVYEDGIITLKEEVTYDDLVDASFELDSYSDRDDKIICGELIGVFDCIECLDILGAKKIKQFVYKMLENEKAIQQSYQMYSGDELEQKIRDWLIFVNCSLTLISNLKDDKMRCYHRAIYSFGDFDPDLQSEYRQLLSDNLMENDSIFNIRNIDSIVNDKFQKAIFGDGTLVYHKLNDIMDAVWAYRDPDKKMEIEAVDMEATSSLLEEMGEQLNSYSDEFDDSLDQDLDGYDEEDYMNRIETYLYNKNVYMTFYLNYINQVNRFSEIFGKDESLEECKGRLLYLLDGYGDNLFKSENLENALNNISMVEIEYREDFDDFYVLSRLFLVDILEGWADDDLTLRKLLFASSYYGLTKDGRIKRVINKYKETDAGQIISKVVLNGDYEKVVNLESGKKLIKENNISDNND